MLRNCTCLQDCLSSHLVLCLCMEGNSHNQICLHYISHFWKANLYARVYFLFPDYLQCFHNYKSMLYSRKYFCRQGSLSRMCFPQVCTLLCHHLQVGMLTELLVTRYCNCYLSNWYPRLYLRYHSFVAERKKRFFSNVPSSCQDRDVRTPRLISTQATQTCMRHPSHISCSPK